MVGIYTTMDLYFKKRQILSSYYSYTVLIKYKEFFKEFFMNKLNEIYCFHKYFE